MKVILRILCVSALAILPATARSAPLGSGFTYQGQIVQNGAPVTGTVTLRFSLWDAASGGTQIGSSQAISNVTATNGLFMVQLNDALPSGQFGANAFNGDARWLQIEVCTDATCSGTPTVLSPRQSASPTPYSSFSGGPWRVNGSAVYYMGNVGIGMTSPHAPLEIESGFGTEVLRFGYSPSDYHYISTGFHGSKPWLDYLGFNVEYSSNDIRRVLTMQGDGNVGIGTDTPQDRLDVHGNVKLGNSGELFAPGGVEPTRVIRGLIGAGGTVFYGTGFTSAFVSTGVATITFNTPFTGNATIVATPCNPSVPSIAITDDTFTGSVTVRTYALNGTPVGVPFHFIVMGPR